MENLEQHFLYLSFFNLKEPPFSLMPSPHFFPSKRHLQILDILQLSILQGSLISVIVGNPGVGKTQTLFTLLERLPSDKYYKVEILNPVLTPEELLKSILWHILQKEGMHQDKMPLFISKNGFEPLKEFGLNKDLALKFIREKLSELKTKQGRLLLIIDEAQLLPDDTIEELRLITNLNEGTEPITQIILFGQPNLRERLLSGKFLPLRQRISVFEELKPIEKNEIVPYIWFLINQVSDSPEISIHKNILRTIFKHTKGVPRLINKLMDRALFIAYTKEEKMITKKHIKEARATFEEAVL